MSRTGFSAPPFANLFDDLGIMFFPSRENSRFLANDINEEANDIHVSGNDRDGIWRHPRISLIRGPATVNRNQNGFCFTPRLEFIFPQSCPN